MTAMLAELPAPWNEAGASAWTTSGYRKLVLDLTGPGTLHRNRYQRAVLEFQETRPWSGEARRGSGWRYADPGVSTRDPWTPGALDRLNAELLPVLNTGDRFATWWAQLTADRGGRSAAGMLEAAAEADRIATWFRNAAELHAMNAAGHLTFRARPNPMTTAELHAARVEVHHPGTRCTYEQIAADALLDGEPVGYLTSEGVLVPA